MNNASIQKEYTITWHIDDVLSIRPDLTKEQASDVLYKVCAKHDASIGVSWDTISFVADWHYPKEETNVKS